MRELQRQPLGHRAPPGRTLALTCSCGRCTARSRAPFSPRRASGTRPATICIRIWVRPCVLPN